MDRVVTWLLFDDLGREKLALLVVCMLAIYALSAHLAWRLRHREMPCQVLEAGFRSWIGRGLGHFLRLLYHVGIPLVVLWRGALVHQIGIPTTYAGDRGMDAILHLLNLTDARDVIGPGLGLVMGGGALCLLVVVWIWYVRTVPTAPGAYPRISWFVALWEACLMQVSWAFYRSFVYTFTADRVRVAFITLALVTFSWLLNPQRRHNLFTRCGHSVVRDWMLVLFTSAIFLVSGALWVLIPLHALWVWVSARTLRRFSPVSSPVAFQPSLPEVPCHE